MECERFLNGEINCGVCAHAWREVNLEDCDEGCAADHNDIFFDAAPGTDCPDWTHRALAHSALAMTEDANP